MKMNGIKHLSARTGLVVAAAGILVVGCGAGAFAAAAPALFAPAGLSADPGVATVPIPKPTYEVNANGLTYGSVKTSDSPANEPDLIAVVTTNDLTTADVSRLSEAAAAKIETGGGTPGYVLKKDLAEADGSNVKNPAEAVKWMEGGAKIDHVVPVYKSDGVTQIGQFVVYGSDSTG